MTALPYITHHLPGVGGQIKAAAEDFIVEEIPLYEPCGHGDHVYIRLERDGWTTQALSRKIAELFDLAEVDLGVAGQKDKIARAVQTFSLKLPTTGQDQVRERIEAELPVKILGISRHTNKLRTGHLAGNRFTILLSGVTTAAMPGAQKIAMALSEKGLPNFFGQQRFGANDRNVVEGRQVLLGRGSQSHWQKRFLLSALQSEMFNTYLVERISRGWFDRVLVGDIAKKTDTGGIFPVENEEAEQVRLIAGQITHTGPIYGTKMRWATEAPGQLEREILERYEFTPEMLRKAKLDGSRRPGRLNISDLSISTYERGLVFQFTLPKGSYATVVMREFTKEEPTGGSVVS